MKKIFVVLAAMLLMAIMACSSGGGDSNSPATYIISGTVTSSGSGLSGVTISLTGTSTTATTGTDGTYTISGLANGNYTVTPSLTGYTFGPISSAVNVSGASVTNTNFTATSDVFAGIQEPSDPGGSMGTPPICISSSVVSLEQKVKAAATTTTVTCDRTVHPSVVSYSGVCNDDPNNPPDCIENQLPCKGTCKYNSVIFEGECVGSVRRYYSAHYGINIPPIEGDEGAYNIWYGYPPPSSQMTKIPIAGNSPQPDDLIVFDSTTSITGMDLGHVAVAVSLQGTQLTIADSNMFCGNAGAVHTIDMNHFTNIVGWYRPVVNNVIVGPIAPTNLTAVAVSSNQINLSWTDNSSDEDGFKIYSSTDNVTYSLLDTLGPNTTSANINNFLPSITFFFHVAAYKGTKNSAWAYASATTESIDNVPITALADGLMFSGVTPHNIAIDSNYVYWFDNNSLGMGWIYKTPIGGGYSSLVANGLSYPVAIAVDDSSVYWIENNLINGTPTGAGGALKKISLNDGTITTLAPWIYAQYMVLYIAPQIIAHRRRNWRLG